MIKFVYFDVANTLLYKPALFEKIAATLFNFGFQVGIEELKYKHKLLSELYKIPDQTSRAFYAAFNTELLCLLGVTASPELADAIFEACTGLPWKKFEDAAVLDNLNVPVGLVSNFNTSLKQKVGDHFDGIFQHIIVSEELGIQKPDERIYHMAKETCGFNYEEILYIGDSYKLDIMPATKTGMHTLLIDRGDFYPAVKNRITALQQMNNEYRGILK